MVIRRAKFNWILWIVWVLVSAAGWGIGLMLNRILSNVEGPLGAILRLAGMGAAIGLVQWIVLRWQIKEAGWWILANGMGLLAGWVAALVVVWLTLLALGLIGVESLSTTMLAVTLLSGTVVGFVMGVLQSMTLPWSIQQLGWWVLSSTAGGALSTIVAWMLTAGVSNAYALLEPTNPFLAITGLAAAVTAVGSPVITGLVLVALRRSGPTS